MYTIRTSKAAKCEILTYATKIGTHRINCKALIICVSLSPIIVPDLIASTVRLTDIIGLHQCQRVSVHSISRLSLYRFRFINHYLHATETSRTALHTHITPSLAERNREGPGRLHLLHGERVQGNTNFRTKLHQNERRSRSHQLAN